MNRARIMVLLGAGLAVGALAGWLRPVPAGLPAADEGAGEWGLPPAAAVERANAAQFENALQLRWIGDSSGTPGGSRQEQDTTWTLRGLLPSENGILVQTGTDPTVKRMATGDILPDGSRIMTVDQDAVLVEHNGCQVRRDLYPRADNDRTPLGEGCADMPSEKESSQP